MLKNYTLSLNTEEMELFRLKHPNVSSALRELIRADVTPDLTITPDVDQEQVFTEPEPFECDKNIPCRQCNQQHCDQRVAPYNPF